MSATASPSPAPGASNISAEDKELLDSLTVTEKLLVAQATYEVGNRDSAGVVKLLSGHALLKHRPKDYFDPEKTAKIYSALTREMGLDAEKKQQPNSPQLLKVARKYYLQRVYELRELMQQEQDRFLITYAEIEEIKTGKHDSKIHLSAPPPLSSAPNPSSLVSPFAGLPPPDPTKPAPRPMFAYPEASPAKGKGKKGKAAEKPARDEWLDWKPQPMPSEEDHGYGNGTEISLGDLPPLPDLGGAGEEGDGLLPLPLPMPGMELGFDMGQLPLPELLDLPPLPELPELPALPDLGGAGEGEAMEGVEAT